MKDMNVFGMSHTTLSPLESFADMDKIEHAPVFTTIEQTVCADKCSGDCFTYEIPLNQCMNPSDVWPGDEQWGTQAFKDSQVSAIKFNRTFFKEGDAACSEVDFV